jgi:hypothetical protein
MTGTNMMRAKVIIFGIFNAALPGYRPVLAPERDRPAVIYIV